VTSTLGDRPEAFGGFEDLREFEGKTGDWDYGQITEGSDAWNQLTDDAIRMAENAKKARGRLGTQEAKDSALKSMIRAMGDIENVNLQRLDQETTRRGYDRDTAASQRAQEAGEQLSSSQLSFQQLADRRNQAFREKFADEQATFERSMAANDQQLAERQQYWNELVGSDMQEWQKLFEQARLGQSGASGAATAATNASNILSGQALAGAAGAQSKYSNIADIFRSQFPAGGTA
jgi:DNA anti-recombination protein RmuC